MPGIQALFWDVGGVLLSNGWDYESRRAAADRFALDWDEFEARHERESEAFETGRLDLDAYLSRVVFYRERTFRREAFRAFMFAQSRPNPPVLALLGELAAAGRWLLVTANNESRELNEHRIREFRLRRYFTAFFSSCYAGVRKPDPGLFRLALDVTQVPPEAALFIDDREENLEGPEKLGIRTLHYREPGQLREELTRFDCVPPQRADGERSPSREE